MNVDHLRQALSDCPQDADSDQALPLVEALRVHLNAGTARAAEPGPDDSWIVHSWVKKGILLGFRLGTIVPYPSAGPLQFLDKDTWPTRDLATVPKLRCVPGGSAVRDGCYLGPGITIMPPAYINVGAWVGEGTLIDSHALVGSCAQIGARVHLSAAAQIGGVLEPIGAAPVIIGDDVLVGGGVGIYEGTRVGAKAVIAAGVVLTRSQPVVDLARQTVHRANSQGVLHIPAGAVVVPGSRPAKGDFASAQGIQLNTPVIPKYRDERTDAATALEDALR